MTQALLKIVATMVALPPPYPSRCCAALLLPAVKEFRAVPGCSAYVLLEDRKAPRRFITYETWADEDALAAHMKSLAMEALSPKLMPMLDGKIQQDFLSVMVEL